MPQKSRGLMITIIDNNYKMKDLNLDFFAAEIHNEARGNLQSNCSVDSSLIRRCLRVRFLWYRNKEFLYS